MIIIHGPDGSGKSAVADHLSKLRGSSVIWTRHQMYLSRFFVFVSTLYGNRLKFYREGTLISGSYYFVGWSKYIYIWLSYFDLKIYLLFYRRQRSKFISDRGLIDRVIDVGVATLDLDLCLTIFGNILNKELQNNNNIFLSVDYEDAINRKPDLIWDLDCKKRIEYYSLFYAKFYCRVYNTSTYLLEDLLTLISQENG
jgi:hypothetical protein